MDGHSTYALKLNLYQLGGLRGLLEKEIAAVERHVRVVGGSHQEYLDQLRGIQSKLTQAIEPRP